MRAHQNELQLTPENASTLTTLNKQFFDQHMQTARSSLAAVDAIFTLKDGKVALHLKKKGSQDDFVKSKEEILSPENGIYTQTKEISHIPLLILEILHDAKLTLAQQKTKLSLVSKTLLKINDDLKPINKTAYYQKEILKQSAGFILCILKNWANIDKEFTIYLKGIFHLLEYNKQIATEAELTRLNDLVNEWISKHSLDLKKTRIIIVSPHGPKPERIAFQYFIDFCTKKGLLPAENNYVYHIEQLPQYPVQDADLIHFLAVAERNKLIGLLFKTSMFSDILREKAPAVLAKLSFFNEDATTKPGVCPLRLLDDEKSSKLMRSHL